MLIEIYADVVCTWAYVGKRRLEAALHEVADRGEALTVVWRPYLIDPMAPSPSEDLGGALRDPVVDSALQQCAPGLSAAENRTRVRDIALSEGIGPPFAARWRASSWAAHRLIDAAADHGATAQGAVVEAIMHAHFVDGEDINALDVLRSIAARFELPAPAAVEDRRRALAYLEPGFDPADRSERRAREALLTGTAIGVRSSPTFVVNGMSALAGAQSVATLVRHFTAAAAMPAAALPDEVRRLRLAEALLERNRDPNGCLYLLAPLRPDHDGERNLEILTARALAAAASLTPARQKLEQLLSDYPDDAYLHLLLGNTLRRLRDSRASRHLAIARAMSPDGAG